jgi:hypothetical protein
MHFKIVNVFGTLHLWLLFFLFFGFILYGESPTNGGHGWGWYSSDSWYLTAAAVEAAAEVEAEVVEALVVCSPYPSSVVISFPRYRGPHSLYPLNAQPSLEVCPHSYLVNFPP